MKREEVSGRGRGIGDERGAPRVKKGHRGGPTGKKGARIDVGETQKKTRVL